MICLGVKKNSPSQEPGLHLGTIAIVHEGPLQDHYTL